jgi:quinol monooxygenase YgiN
MPQDLYQTHFTSAAMGNFLKKIPATMTTGLDLMHYSCVAGYIDQPGDKKECEIMQDTRISCISASARNAVLSKLKQLAKSIDVEGSGVYTWMAFSSLDDDVGARIFVRFESREAMEAYARRKDVAEFWSESKDDVKQMEWRCYVPNNKGWLHR